MRDLYRVWMRWSALFGDMELQLDAAGREDRDRAVADLTRAERASVTLGDRLRACGARDVRLVLRDGTSVRGKVQDVGPVWLLVGDQRRESLVPFTSVAAVDGLPDVAAPPEGGVLRRLGLGHALRAIARDRLVVRVLTSAGVTVGRVESVGADHLDVSLVHPDSARPSGERQAIAFGSLLLVTSL